MKFFSVLFAALLTAGPVLSQRLGGNHNEEAGPYNTGFGLKAGVNIASVYSLPSGVEAEGITSYHVGAYGKLGITDAVGFQLEALYSRRGFDFKEAEGKLRMDYIDVPLLFTFNIVGENTWTFMAGPQASLMITLKDEEDQEIDKSGFHTFDAGLAGGVQFGYKIIRVGGRYNIGLRDVVDTKEAGSDEFNFKNHWGQVYLAVEF